VSMTYTTQRVARIASLLLFAAGCDPGKEPEDTCCWDPWAQDHDQDGYDSRPPDMVP